MKTSQANGTPVDLRADISAGVSPFLSPVKITPKAKVTTVPKPVVKKHESNGPRKLLTAFYAVNASIALYGQTQGIVRWLGIREVTAPVLQVSLSPQLIALVPAAAVELLAAVLFAFADWRRTARQESALAARTLGILVSVAVAGLNYAGHSAPDEVGQRALFVGASLAAFSVWVLQSNARRRDKQYEAGKRRVAPPEYGIVQWLTHPKETWRARQLAMAGQAESLTDSLELATQQLREEEKRQELVDAIKARIAKDMPAYDAKVALGSLNVDSIADKLASQADNDGVVNRLAAELAVERLITSSVQAGSGSAESSAPAEPSSAGKPNRVRRRVRKTVRPGSGSGSASSGESSASAELGSGESSAESSGSVRPGSGESSGHGSTESSADPVEAVREFVLEFNAQFGRPPGRGKVRQELARHGVRVGMDRAAQIISEVLEKRK